MISLSGLLIPELEQLLSPLPVYRARQIYKWIIRGITDFDEMTDIPNSLKNELKERFTIYSSKIESFYDDKDAKKIIVSLKDTKKIEAVLLKDKKERLTACLSTQSGCPIGCVFCKTGTLGFSRNLTSHEIVEQFFFLNLINEQRGAKSCDHIIDNIVIMGMGEPLLNLMELRKAIKFFSDKNGLNYSLRRITLSTCGIIDGLKDLAENGPYLRLALSLTTADEMLRTSLMPVTASNPLEKVKEALIAFQRRSKNRITLEIPLLGGINTREKDAKSIADFARGLNTVANIIPWNPVEGVEFNGKKLIEPEKKETEIFIRLLESYGMKVTMRHKKGRKITGACGQLGQCSSNEPI